MMELSEYLETTIGEFFKGLRAASAAAKDHGASINPPAYGSNRRGSYEINDLVMLEFDIGVVVKDSVAGKAGAKITVAGVGAEIGGGKDHVSEVTNRMRFTIPVQLPVGEKLGVFHRPTKTKSNP